ncbi:murein hydrolase activator EnvC family protein [Aestuariivirga sp.]|uniref:murein hydrolase activator EnvC family protein n=1 Tax=Aestuariivirga sp. TaxID=2650926 RepID=UPI0039E24D5C
MLTLPRHLMLAAALAAGLSLGSMAAQAEGDPAQDLAALEAQLAAAKEAQAALVRRMVEAIRAQEEASAKLVELAAKARTQEEALAKTDARLDKLQADNAKALLALAQKRDSLSKLLAGLQRLEQNPPPALVVSPGDVLTALRGAMMFGAVIPDLRHDMEELKQALADVETIKQALQAEKQRSADALSALERTRGEMAMVVSDRQKAAEEIAAALSTEKAKSDSLAAEARTLQDLVAVVEREKADEARRQQAEADARAKAEAERLAREEAARVQAEADAARAAKPPVIFAKALGQLDYPVEGKLWKGFGADNGLDGKTAGIFLAAQPKAQVLSPADGTIAFAGTFHSYDQVVIINPGDGYLVLLAGMHEITAAQGQTVRAGEPVGFMGDKPAHMALAADLTQAASPVLYVEFRKRNEPVDPSPWWRTGGKEAMR